MHRDISAPTARGMAAHATRQTSRHARHTHPGITHPGITHPGITHPGITHPGITPLVALVLVGLVIVAPLAAAQPIRSDSAFVRTLGTEIDRLLAAPLFTRTLAAVEISDPATGRILYARNADLLLRPASLMKLATSAAAVRAFDADAQFRMEVRAGVDAGGLADLVLRASGDPFMDAQDMTTLVDMLRARGARGIRSLVLDGAAFDTIPFGEGWMWDDEDAAFTPHMDGFLFGTGTWRLAATTRGSVVRVEPAPDLGIARIATDVRIGTRTDLSVRRRRDSNEITVSGSMRAADSFRTEVSMAQPRVVFRAALVEALVRGGVPPLDSLVSPPLVDTLPLIGTITHPIGEAVQAMNTRSDNRCAEAVLRLLGARAGTGSARTGVEAVRMLLDSAGVRTDGFVQVDGSGLSSYNLGSAAAFGSLLRAMATGVQAERFRTTLARGGATGTLRGRLQGRAGAQRVRAKTGTMRGISGLAGYVERERGAPLAFVIMMQNFKGEAAAYRAVQDAIVALLLDAEASAPAGTTPTR